MKKNTPAKAKRKSAKAVTNVILLAEITRLQTSIKAVQEWMSVHEMADNTRFKESHELTAALPTKTDLNRINKALFNDDGTEKLASKQDTDEVLQVFGNIERGAVFVQAGGKWAFRALLVLAAIVAAITTIFGGWKTVFGLFIR